MKPSISVVMPVLNEEKYIEKALRSFKNQTFTNFELIVVDGRSVDKTVQIAKNYGAKTVLSEKRGVCIQRNLGLKTAQSEIVVCADADTEYSPEHLSLIYNAFSKSPNVIAVGGSWSMPDAPSWARNLWKVTVLSLEKLYSIFGWIIYIPAFNLSYKKSVLLKMGGYDERLDAGGDEIDILNKLKKYKKDYEPKSELIFLGNLGTKNSGRRWSLGFLNVIFKQLIMGYWVNYISRKYFSQKIADFKPIR